MGQQKKAYFALMVTSIVWGTTWVASKAGIAHMPAFQLASIRQCLGGSLYILFFIFIKKEGLPTKKEFLWLLPMSFLMFVSSNGIATYGLQYISSGLAALIAALYPLSVVLIERFYYKAIKLTPSTLIGLFLGLLGIGFIFYKDSMQLKSQHYILGVALSLFAMFTWSIGTIIISRTKTTINAYYGIGWQMFISAIVMATYTIVTGNYVPLNEIPFVSWATILYMVIGGSIFAFISFIYTMKYLKASIAALYAYINPIVAIWVGSLVLGESKSWNSIVGTIITLVGVYLVNKSLKEQKDPVNSIADADGM
jgi:drug/metabolite transporter (DMT)-like permease